MPYTTLLVHVDNSSHCPRRVRLAVRLAIAEGAHLIGSAMSGISRYAYGGGVNALQFAPAQMQALRGQASDALHDFECIAREEGLSAYETRFVDDDAQGALLLQARYCDLLILGQTDAQDTPSRVIAGTAEYLMLHCGRPVLMVPHAPSPTATAAIGQRPLLAWNGSAEALRAITDALPLLRRAQQVTLAVVNSHAQPAAHGEQPGADLALYLARHGVNVDVLQHDTPPGQDVGAALLAMAAQRRCDLLVMGCYGHMRLRETLLGGVTRTVLQEMTLPVLVSH
ncbi:universal stress protein [Janthinobacterium sp. 1_2014MBL_MicDiv]|uniref:universal stress protein n=1 Tax=Janthinobacterium sp. 1_2014MBL_MicDiv TaxID=1644131 RepID=UPI0008F4D5CD|nr:universal stress protein [Janthinobacterium sp. 1_2014MBL_MicDiv]APA68683.1 universal stress protein [Janthinobacterium sp. 1_2014MBL_MicDiv]